MEILVIRRRKADWRQMAEDIEKASPRQYTSSICKKLAEDYKYTHNDN